MPEKSREQWLRSIRRRLAVGGAMGFGFGTFAHFAWDASSNLPGWLGALAFYVPMGAALVLMLWASMYERDFAKVWGRAAMGLTFMLMLLLIATSISVGCLQGICGER